jgi:hypothetical protein
VPICERYAKWRINEINLVMLLTFAMAEEARNCDKGVIFVLAGR